MSGDTASLVALLFAVALLASGFAVWSVLRARRLEGIVAALRGRLGEADAKLSLLDTERAGQAERRERLERDLRETLDRAAQDRSESAARIATLETAAHEQARQTDLRLKEAEEARALMTAQLAEAREQMASHFDALAGQVIRQHGEDFRRRAGEQLPDSGHRRPRPRWHSRSSGSKF